jgi:condensin complex subunit 1
VYRSLLKNLEVLSGYILNKTLDSILSGFNSEIEAATRDVDSDSVDSIAHHRLPLEHFAFLLHWFVMTGERKAAKATPAEKPKKGAKGSKKKSSNEEWVWEEQLPHILAAINKTLRLKTQRIWTTTAERDVFIKFVDTNLCRVQF